MPKPSPNFRLRKDHTCHSIGPFGLEESEMCDKCKFFKQRKEGRCGRRPGKNTVPKCEKPWMICGGITKQTPTRLMANKKKYILILKKYYYTVIDDDCDKESTSRLYDKSYRQNWTKLSTDYSKLRYKLKEDRPHISTANSSHNLEEEGSLSANASNEIAQIPFTTTTPNETVQTPITTTTPNQTAETPITTTIPHETVTIEQMLHHIYPRKLKRTVKNNWKWDDSEIRHIPKKKHIVKEAKSLETVLQVISNNNITFAGQLISSVIRKNSSLQCEYLDPDSKVFDAYKDIVDSIKKFASDRLVKSTKTSEKEMLHGLITACTYQLDDTTNRNFIRQILGISSRTFYKSISEENENNKESYCHIERKRKHERDVTKRQKDSIITFCHSDDSSSVDSNSKRIVEVMKGEICEKHVGRVWSVKTIDEQYSLFINSEIVETCKNMYGGGYIIPSRSLFYSNRCPCVVPPTKQSCVDITKSAMQHYMRAISKYVRTNKTIRDQLTTIPWIKLLSGHAEDLVDSICCEKLPHPALKYGLGSSTHIPTLLQWPCIYGTCQLCGIEIKHKMSTCTVLMSDSTVIDLLEWKNIARQGMKNGKQNTQLELSLTQLPVNLVMKKMIGQLVKCRRHVGEMRWINCNRKVDIAMSNANTTRVICTDFGATLDLSASEKDNSSVDNHAVICIFFVIYDWRNVTFKRKDGTEDETIINTCDKWIVFGDTLSKGKKNDHVFHNTCLAYLRKYYDDERERAGKSKVQNNIIHTDNCPTRYKCRQNFSKLQRLERSMDLD